MVACEIRKGSSASKKGIRGSRIAAKPEGFLCCCATSTHRWLSLLPTTVCVYHLLPTSVVLKESLLNIVHRLLPPLQTVCAHGSDKVVYLCCSLVRAQITLRTCLGSIAAVVLCGIMFHLHQDLSPDCHQGMLLLLASGERSVMTRRSVADKSTVNGRHR